MNQQRRYDPFLDSKMNKLEWIEKSVPTIKGYPFPLDRTAPGGYFTPAYDTEVIKADLIQLLLTEPGERVMMPQFGTGLRKYIFEQGTNSMTIEIEKLIISAISTWEKRIIVDDITVYFPTGDSRLSYDNDDSGQDTIEENSISIRISFKLKENLEVVDNLVFKLNYDSELI